MTLLPPSDYPWPESPRSGLLTHAEFLTQPEFLEGDALPDPTARTPVIAVGSNAARTVLRNKLGSLLQTGLPVAVAQVERLAVGHSAHVSARGYIAAAPFVGEGRVSGRSRVGDGTRASGRSRVDEGSQCGNVSRPMMLGWFDHAQLAAMDATEPNYRRIPLPSRVQCRLDGVLLTGVEIYESVHGVLGEADVPLEFLGQDDVLAWLATRLPTAVAAGLDHEALTDTDRREQVRTALLEADLVVPSGL